MSTIKAINLIHPSGSTTNIVADNLGNVTIGAALKFSDGSSQTTATSALTGETIQYASQTPPTGFLKCDGSTYTKTSYPALATALGSLPVTYAQYYNVIAGSLVGYVNGTTLNTNNTNVLARSTDGGASYTSVALTGTQFPRADRTVWTGTNYVSPAFADGGGGGGGVVYASSLTATSWTNYSTGMTGGALGPIAFTGSRLVATYSADNPGQNGSFYSTTNGTSWVAGGSPGVASTGTYFAAGLVVAVGMNSTGTTAVIATTPDGTTWTARTVPTGVTGTFAYLTYQNGLFIAVTTNSHVCSSSDGITWTLKSRLSNGQPGQIIYLASTGLYYAYNVCSPDLINWSTLPVAPGYFAYTSIYQATDGTRIITGSTSYNPFPYTTATQFVVPNFGTNAVGTQGTWGAYNHIKT